MNELSLIGKRIRELREICGFSEEETAKELSVSLETYRSYEQNGSDIPISALHHLSNMFKVDMSVLLTGISAHLNDYTLVKAGRGKSVSRYPGYAFSSLAENFNSKIMEPLLVTVEPSEFDPALVTHGGQEFNMVLEGTVEFLFKEKRLFLEIGDCIYFNPSYPHGQKAANGKTAKFLTVIAE